MARRVAAFDFDGTLAKGDSLLPFLVRVRGRRAVGTVLAAQGPSIAMALAGVADGGAGGGGSRDRAKAALVGRLLRGLPADAVGREGEAFARRLLERRMRPEMSERVAWHRDQGHDLVMVSASLAVYLEPLGRLLGFDHVLATGLEVGDDGLLTGNLLGANVRGPEKAARLTAWLGDDAHDVELWAYGDSRGDHDLLALARTPFLVGRRGRLVAFTPPVHRSQRDKSS